MARIYDCIRLEFVLALALLPTALAHPSERSPLWQRSPQPQHAKFTWAGSGRTGKPGALEVSFTRYKSQDGVVVERIAEKYGSHAQAVAQLQKLKKTASRVDERAAQQLAGRNADQMRVVATLNGDRLTKPKAVIAWTDGPVLNLIESVSLPVAIDFEQQTQAAAAATTPKQ